MGAPAIPPSAPGLSRADAFSLAHPAPAWIAAGDSITAQASVASSGVTLTRTGGNLVTAAQTAHGYINKQMITVEQYADTTLAGAYTITVTGPNSYTFPSVGPNGADASATGRIRNPYQMADNGYVTWISGTMGSRLPLIWNAGRGGDTSTQLLARFDADVISRVRKGTLVSILIGTNDGPAGIPTATTIANVRAMYAKVRAAGGVVVAGTILPRSDTTSYIESVLEINQTIRLDCKNNTQMVLWDAYAAIIDPNSATGAPLAGMLASDNLHPSARGSQPLARSFVSTVGYLLPPLSTLVSSAADNRTVGGSGNTNLWDSLPSTTTGGSVSGTNVTGTPPFHFQVATNGGSLATIVASGVARTVAADGDALGYNCKAAFIPAAIGDECRIQQQSSTWWTGATVGKAYRLECSVRVENNAGILSELNARIQYTIDGVVYTFYFMRNTGTAFPTGDFSVIMRSVPFVLTGASLTNIDMRVTAIAGATGSAVNIYEGRVSFREVPSGEPVTY